MWILQWSIYLSIFSISVAMTIYNQPLYTFPGPFFDPFFLLSLVSAIFITFLIHSATQSAIQRSNRFRLDRSKLTLRGKLYGILSEQPFSFLLRDITRPLRIPPHIMILGEQKSGSTALASALLATGRVFGPLSPIDPPTSSFPWRNKETQFFSGACGSMPGESLKLYLRHFPLRFTHNFYEWFTQHRYFVMDATPDHFSLPFMPRLMKAFALQYGYKPKMIVTLREPVSRAYSHWNMVRFIRSLQPRLPPEVPTFEDAVECSRAPLMNEILHKLSTITSADPLPISEISYYIQYGFIQKSTYVEVFENWLQDGFWKIDDFLVIFSDEMRSDPHSVATNLFRFIGFDGVTKDIFDRTKDSMTSSVNSLPYSAHHSSVSIFHQLHAFFSDYNRRLETLLQRSLPKGWNEVYLPQTD